MNAADPDRRARTEGRRAGHSAELRGTHGGALSRRLPDRLPRRCGGRRRDADAGCRAAVTAGTRHLPARRPGPGLAPAARRRRLCGDGREPAISCLRGASGSRNADERPGPLCGGGRRISRSAPRLHHLGADQHRGTWQSLEPLGRAARDRRSSGGIADRRDRQPAGWQHAGGALRPPVLRPRPDAPSRTAAPASGRASAAATRFGRARHGRRDAQRRGAR